MSKRRKPLKIDEIYHEQSGITVPIYLSVSGKSFQATLPDDKEVGDQNRHELDKKIKTWLDENTVLEWLPVIQVDEYSLNYGDSSKLVGFDFNRMWYAKKKSGTGMMYKHWEAEKSGSWPSWETKWGIEAKDFNPPCFSKGNFYRGSTDFYLPYTEETWEELKKLQDALIELKKVLRHVLGAGEGLARLRINLIEAITPQLNEIPAKEEKFEI